MIVLGLDTATADTVVGLARDGAPLGSARDVPPPGGRPGHVEQVLPLAQRLLDEAGLRFADVDLVAVGIGPGTFTGLRIGVATARALAHAAGSGIVGVPTLAVLAAASGHDGPVLACLDARRREVFVAAWPDGAAAAADGRPPAAGPVAVAPAEAAERSGASGSGWIAVGDGALRHRDVLAASGVAIPSDDDPRHRVDPQALCALGARLGPLADPDALRPQYVRAPDAVPVAEREGTR